MKILFIGGTGNLSGDCAAVLRRRGHDVTILTRGRGPTPSDHRVLVADRYDESAMRNALGKEVVDVVINFLGFDLPELHIDLSLLASRIRQYIFISSTTVYAKPHALLPLTEHSPVGNRYSPYARKKQACEQWLMLQYRNSRFPVTIVRPSHTYSCRWLPNAVASSSFTFAARLVQGRPVFVHGNGQNLWTLTAAEDFATGLAGLVGLEAAVGEIFHITSDQVLTWNQIYAEMARALGVVAPEILKIPLPFICKVAPEMEAGLRGDKAEHGVFDNAKIKRFVPDFECRTTVRQGLQQSADWLMSEPSRQSVNPDVEVRIARVIDAWRGEQVHAD